MLANVLISVLLLLAPFAGYARGNDVKDNNPSQLEVHNIVTKLNKGEIGRVEILNIPSYILTRTRITPEMLERQFDYKFMIRDVRGEMYEKPLLEAVKSIVAQPLPVSEMADIRWGVIFYGADDTRIGAIYFDKTGRNGAVNSAPVSFNGGFFKWLYKNFSESFR